MCVATCISATDINISPVWLETAVVVVDDRTVGRTSYVINLFLQSYSTRTVICCCVQPISGS